MVFINRESPGLAVAWSDVCGAGEVGAMIAWHREALSRRPARRPSLLRDISITPAGVEVQIFIGCRLPFRCAKLYIFFFSHKKIQASGRKNELQRARVCFHII